MKARAWGLSLLAAGALSCGAPPSPPPASPAQEASAKAPPASPPLVAAEEPSEENLGERERAAVQAMLVQVARARELPVLREVKSQVLNREEVLQKIRAKIEKEMPMDVVAEQGEFLAALGMVPPDYDFVEGMFRLVQGRIAGFYEPLDETMYLLDDLDEEEAKETLAHELVHALQDQSYPLSPLLKYDPNKSDQIAAAHAVIEGDATSAMLDVVAGSAFNVNEGLLRTLFAASTALSETGAKTPRALQASLTAPYTDGFAFVQKLREQGGWAAVNEAWKALPETTEQLLHLDKYRAHEAAIAVEAPSVGPLGEGFRAALDDTMGEQGLRITLEEWTFGPDAQKAAAGWGGDRFVIARRDHAGKEGDHEVALGWKVVFDSAADAKEMAAVLKKRFGEGCKERETEGPLAWAQKGAVVSIAAGPYTRFKGGMKSAGSCKVAKAWVRGMMK